MCTWVCSWHESFILSANWLSNRLHNPGYIKKSLKSLFWKLENGDPIKQNTCMSPFLECLSITDILRLDQVQRLFNLLVFTAIHGIDTELDFCNVHKRFPLNTITFGLIQCFKCGFVSVHRHDVIVIKLLCAFMSGGECHCWWTKESLRAHVAKFYDRLRSICSVWRASKFPC